MTATWGISKGDLFLMNVEQAKKIGGLYGPSEKMKVHHFQVFVRVVQKDKDHQDVVVPKAFLLLEEDLVSFLVTKPRAWKKGTLHLFAEDRKFDSWTGKELPVSPKPLFQHYHYGLLSLHNPSCDQTFYAYIGNDELDRYLLQRKNGGG